MDEDQLTEALNDIGKQLWRVADSITSRDSAGGRDAAGVHVGCLTESIMGLTAGVVQIADAIRSVADAINRKTP